MSQNRDRSRTAEARDETVRRAGERKRKLFQSMCHAYDNAIAHLERPMAYEDELQPYQREFARLGL